MNEAEGLRQRRPLRSQVVTEDTAAQAAKDGSTYSSKVFRVTFMTLAVTLIIPLLGAILLLECPIDPQHLSLKEPPILTGVLEPNIKLRQAERLFENQIIGPESIVNIGDVLFTGTADGKILRIEDGEIQTLAQLGHGPCRTREDEPDCGRPLGIRVGPNNTLFVADAYNGIYEINPVTGEVQMLLSTKAPIEGQKLSFLNDLTLTRDGRKIYFTDSSSKWQRRDFPLLVMEGRDDGRLFEYDTVTKEVKVLMVGLRFPNGVELSPAEDFVLVAELTLARIRRYYVSGLMKGGADMFVENMPGFPDNIRRSSSGGYWVAMSAIRPNPGFSMMDFLSEKPWIKRIIFKLLSQDTVIKFVPRYSLVIELGETGSYKRSFHDPNGMVVAYVSEAHEHDGYLYLGSFRSPFICRLNLEHV
ncbi:adipocyte plasma membrane-associated protein [Alligator mississippiensis]|uniref:Adipocyte plasma membrane-associated protein n=1 Tax=Alligator mississippiensis TaxID=8496 RepID=A0A151M1H6_ALLMI|nr:adipocyte plasma membrane-associated protein [Alligator mississippiensis]KYO18359.1 adipocyte plasma membrane-associated protein [Alligator mississippiensis]